MTESILGGVIIGAAGGSVAGIVLWIVGRLNEYEMEWRDSKRLYKWLEIVTRPNDSKPWRSTKAIASYNNLTEDRVRYICSYHPKINMSSGEKKCGQLRAEAEINI
jgi:hypothetical protein